MRKNLSPVAVTVPTLDQACFAVFAGYLILAFTTAFPDQFALPKLLGLYVYTTFCAVRWALAARGGRVNALPGVLPLTTLAVACWWTTTTLTAQHVTTALFGMRGRYNGLAAMLAGLALFFFVATARMNARGVEQRLGAICAALAVASVYGVAQAVGLDFMQWPLGRPPSTLGHPVILAGALAIALPFTLAFSLDGRSRVARGVWGASTIAQGLALALTLARGAWIAAVCGVLVFAALGGLSRRPIAGRFAALAACATFAAAAALALSTPARAGVLARVSTLAHLAGDSSVSYRVHFCRAALGMLRDHPWVGVGWENFGLLYPAYRSSPTPSIGPDLIPTMVHSGPLQTAVSGGVAAVALQALFVVAVVAAVAGRLRDETDGRQRLLGAAFIASVIAFLVQDLSGWPHVALAPLAFVIWGLGVSWSLRSRPRPAAGGRWPLVLLGLAIGIGSAWMSLDTWRRVRAERLMFEVQGLDVQGSWGAVERKLRAAIDVSPDKAWANDAAARVYLRRAAAAKDRRAYERGVELTTASRAANPFDPYARLRRAELDVAAIEHGLLPGMTEDGRQALAAAKVMAGGSVLVQRVEASLLRKTGRVVWIEPQATAGFGPTGSLVVAGSAPAALAGIHVFLHWRNATRGSSWTTEAYAPVPYDDGSWYNAIPNAIPGESYEVYATLEASSFGPCAYTGSRNIQLCAPLALIGPAPAPGLPGRLVVAGSVPETQAEHLVLHWRNATYSSAWTVEPFDKGGAGRGVLFPPDAPGNWYSVIAEAARGERYQAYLSTAKAALDPCTYSGDGSPTLCSPIGWIQPRDMAGFGPPGSLVVAGAAPIAWSGAPVFLHWRNATRRSAWTTEAYAPVPDERGVWYNAIPNADLGQRYEAYVTAPTTESNRCTYLGAGLRDTCP